MARSENSKTFITALCDFTWAGFGASMQYVISKDAGIAMTMHTTMSWIEDDDDEEHEDDD